MPTIQEQTPSVNQTINHPIDLDDPIEKAVNEEVTTLSKKDPAPTPVQAAVSQSNVLIEQNCLHAVNKLRTLRDEIDHTMRALQDKSEDAKRQVVDLGQFVEASDIFHKIAAEQLRKVREQYQLKQAINGHAS